MKRRFFPYFGIVTVFCLLASALSAQTPTWVPMTPLREDAATKIIIAPNNNYYLYTDSVWRSTDQGKTWATFPVYPTEGIWNDYVPSGIMYVVSDTEIYDIFYDWRQNSKWVPGVSSTLGLLWTPFPLPSNLLYTPPNTQSYTPYMDDRGGAYLVTRDSVYLTFDRGAHWVTKSSSDVLYYPLPLPPVRDFRNHLFVNRSSSKTGTLFHSIDSATSWQRCLTTSTPIIQLKVYASSVAAYTADSVYTTIDGGMTWQATRNISITGQLPAGATLTYKDSTGADITIVNGSGPFLSRDHGATWEEIGNANALKKLTIQGGQLLSISTPGNTLSRFDFATNTWKLVAFPTDTKWSIDDTAIRTASQISYDAGTTWEDIPTNLSHVDQDTNANTMGLFPVTKNRWATVVEEQAFSGLPNARDFSIAIADRGSTTFHRVQHLQSHRVPRILRLQNNVLLVDADSLWVSYDNGANWSAFSKKPFPLGDSITTARFVWDNHLLVWENTRVHETSDGGRTWVLDTAIPRLTQVYYSKDEDALFGIARYNALEVTRDHGKTWQWLNDSVFTGAGTNGYLYRSVYDLVVDGQGNLFINQDNMPYRLAKPLNTVRQPIAIGNEIALYPNPASTLIRLRSQEPVLLRGIYNILGQQQQASSTTSSARTELSIDLTALRPGQYFLRLQQGNSIVSKQITVTR